MSGSLLAASQIWIRIASRSATVDVDTLHSANL